MLDKGVIHKVVQWRRSREFLYWRLRRKILEASVAARIEVLNKRMKRRESLEMLRQWFIEDVGENNRFSWDKDGTVVDWLEEQVGNDLFYPSWMNFNLNLFTGRHYASFPRHRRQAAAAGCDQRRQR